MKSLFLEILKNYLENKSKPFGKNEFANYIRSGPSNIIDIDDSKYLIEGSPGKGNWATIPWISIFDKEITTSASKEGYYIVYLFCADMSGVYLSLNQGWTYYQDKYKITKGKKEIQKVSLKWRDELNLIKSEFDFKIDLKSNITLAQGYELGHICGKYYSINDFPEDQVLENDLKHLLLLYQELKNKLNVFKNMSTIDDTILLSNEINESFSLNPGKLILKNQFVPTSQGKSSKKERQVDYLKKMRSTIKLGKIGERLVLE